mmetsp:Transcript_29726/g.47995  ORF Transcript_29726/g.47995 Transcript_29726/m.47995 type:complete len:175 (-) Transcript_29726:179-703(-)
MEIQVARLGDYFETDCAPRRFTESLVQSDQDIYADHLNMAQPSSTESVCTSLPKRLHRSSAFRIRLDTHHLSMMIDGSSSALSIHSPLSQQDPSDTDSCSSCPSGLVSPPYSDLESIEDQGSISHSSLSFSSHTVSPDRLPRSAAFRRPHCNAVSKICLDRLPRSAAFRRPLVV